MSQPKRSSDLQCFEAMASETETSTSRSTTTALVEPCSKEERLMIRIALKDEACQPLAKVPYRLVVDGEQWERETTAEGLVEQEVPAESQHGSLEVWPSGDREEEPLEYELELGQMDPVGLDSGQVSRLHNLGFTGADTEHEDPELVDDALFYFRWWAGLPDEPGSDQAVEQALGAVYEPSSDVEPRDPFDLPAEEPFEESDDEPSEE